MKKIKELWKEHSPYLLILTGIETVFSLIAILSFVVDDFKQIPALNNIALLIDNMYTQTWWGLVLLTMGLISILAITCIVYKNLEYLFISISLWFLLFILSFNLASQMNNLVSVSLLFIPIIIINIIAYNKEKNVLNIKTKKRK